MQDKKDIFTYTTEAAMRGKSWSVYLTHRTIRVNGKVIVDHGKVADGFVLPDINKETLVEVIGKHYAEYKRSVPTESSERRRHPYFRALEYDELPQDALISSMNRDIAQAALETFILCAVLKGVLTMEALGAEPKHFFWQHPEDKDFVIYRSFIELPE